MKNKKPITGTIKIDTSKITEQEFLEGCFNMFHSGRDPTFALCLYAMAKSWHYLKLEYYLREIGLNSMEY